MKELGSGFDGTLSKAIETSKLASGKSKWLQDYMLAGDFKIGSIKKVDGTSLGTEKNIIDTNFEDFTAQLATLDKSSQRVTLKGTNPVLFRARIRKEHAKRQKRSHRPVPSPGRTPGLPRWAVRDRDPAQGGAAQNQGKESGPKGPAHRRAMRSACRSCGPHRRGPRPGRRGRC